MKFNRTCSFVFVIAAMVCGSIGAGPAGAARPQDFSIAYQLNSGSVPSPYYHEITINVDPSGRGQIQLVPDYQNEGVPQWTESFEADAGKLDALYGLLQEESALTRKWQAPTPLKLGAPNETIRITAQGQQMDIPSQVVKDQMQLRDRISKAIKALVPDTIWQELKNRHRNYSKEHYPNGA